MNHKILIVEDDTDLREGLSFSFSNDGHHVEEVETKKDGLRKIANGCFDIILLDLVPGFAKRLGNG